MADKDPKAITLRIFNPGTMQSDEEIIDQFVVRHCQFNIIMEVIQENLDASANQHVLVVGPRGRGKTMLLARIAAEIRRDDGLSKRLLPVRFMEESMEILGIADFWLECLLHLGNALAADYPDQAHSLRQTREALADLLDDQALELRARAAVLDVADRLDRRLVLMVENLQSLAQQTDKDFGWQLRKTLQHEPRIMLIASATSSFAALDNVDQPFFETFRELTLPPLDSEECARLWRVVTGEAISEREITPLKILTGGSPRFLVLMAGFARHRSMRELMEELVTLIDDHTEYFRGHLEALAPKERRVYIAVIDLWQPSSANEVARRARMDIRPVSSLLGRLVTRGAVIADESGQKKKHYRAAERLYSIYYKLRRERNEAAVIQGLVLFMAAFYSGSNLKTFVDSLVKESRQVKEIRTGFQLAMHSDTAARKRLMSQMSFDACVETLGEDTEAHEWIRIQLEQVRDAHERLDFEAALNYVNQVIDAFANAKDLEDSVATFMSIRIGILGEMGRMEEALASCQELIDRFGDAQVLVLQQVAATAWFYRGKALTKLDRKDEALASYQEVFDRFGDAKFGLQELVAEALFNRGSVLSELGRIVESLACYQILFVRFGNAEALKIKQLVAHALHNRSVKLREMGRTSEALDSCQNLIERFGDAERLSLQKSVAQALVRQGVILSESGRTAEALICYQDLIERFGDAEDFEMQNLVAGAIVDSVSLIPGVQKELSNLYAAWYERLPPLGTEVLGLFTYLTSYLYASGISAADLLAILDQDAKKAAQLHPLIIALRQENGEVVRAPDELLEVAADVRKQMAEAKNNLQPQATL